MHHPYRSVMADMLRERHRLLEMLYYAPMHRERILDRLRELEALITLEEDNGPRTYLDHIMNRANFAFDSPPQPQ
ncbi:MAG: hypothetical protein RDV00_04030 [Clostridia bacterium]|nr:hypothetical protein [Clostridia bacterium]MDQ7791282.1 hypothetical protein [Clostridia bacterium]